MSLRLEKNKGGYRFKLKAKQPLFSFDFLLALSIAIFVHLSAFALFKVDLGMIFKIYKEDIPLKVQAPRLEKGLLATIDSTNEEKKDLFPFKITRSENPEQFAFQPNFNAVSHYDKFEFRDNDLYEKEKPPFYGYLSLFPSDKEVKKIELQSLTERRIKIAYVADVKKKEFIWFDIIEGSHDPLLDKTIIKYLKNIPYIGKSEPFERGIAIIEFRK